ncbi:ribonuclease III family protein [Blattabacterium cuenoti]|uniref:ribonuclease III family protein n=1 Tax=Blattabacterium cuenoti TaxID=1653831 RepID=UPI00163C6253|nr:ribonuclease III domain-containing protein [Blattabacterium cuenoti]
MLSNNNIIENKFNSLFINKLIKILGFIPKNVKFLKEVFIYSFSVKKKNYNKNYYMNFQRLEFLGDSILNSIISHFLYEQLSEKKEGELTQIRAKIVCRNNLNKISKKLTIINIFIKENIPIISDNILGNTLEALIGFIYLDIGYQGCKNFVYKKILHNHVNLLKLQKEIFSYKVWIIEWSQKNKFIINFNTFKEKKIEKKNINIYLSECIISNYGIKTKGKGFSKKRSEELAAKKAYFLIQKKIKKNI